MLASLIFILGCQKHTRVSSAVDDAELNALIIGTDDRQEVLQPSSLTSTVGQIFTQNAQTPAAKGACTATLIAKNYLITAAHCVFAPDKGGVAESVLFMADAFRTKKDLQALYFVEKVYLLKEHVELRNRTAGFKSFMVATDLAVLKLADLPAQRPAGEVFGFLPVAKSQPSREATVISYPGDKPESSKWIQNSCQLSPFLKFLTIDCDLIVGASGGAIIVGSKSQPEIRAVVSGESLDHNLVAVLSDSMVVAIQDILAGKSQSLFEEYETFSQSYHRLFVHNDCDEALFLGLRWMNLDGEEQVDGFHILQPGQMLPAAKMTSNVFYLSAMKADRSYELKGSVPMDVGGTRVMAIQQQVLGSWQDVHYRVNCQ